MTKKEIFNNNWKFTSGPPILGMSSIFQSMDEYAKQQAIAFVKWALESDKIHGDNWGDAFMPGDEEDVYNQFIEQQNKDNG